MKKLELMEMEGLKAGYSAWQCFWSVPKLVVDLSSSMGEFHVGYDLALIKFCWKN